MRTPPRTPSAPSKHVGILSVISVISVVSAVDVEIETPLLKAEITYGLDLFQKDCSI